MSEDQLNPQENPYVRKHDDFMHLPDGAKLQQLRADVHEEIATVRRLIVMLNQRFKELLTVTAQLDVDDAKLEELQRDCATARERRQQITQGLQNRFDELRDVADRLHEHEVRLGRLEARVGEHLD